MTVGKQSRGYLNNIHLKNCGELIHWTPELIDGIKNVPKMQYIFVEHT